MFKRIRNFGVDVAEISIYALCIIVLFFVFLFCDIDKIIRSY
jgi:hypothetical protein